ncbi:hypothetical protein B566_EDAN009645 [Ephemera danica]|nr:hypothetical protein B566_EDAN009645 [Ephemera danica]
MESQQTVMIPNDTLFSSDGRNFMVSLPVETADGAGVINVPIIFTTDASSTTDIENQPVSNTVGTDITSGESTGGFVLKNLNGDAKNGFFLDASQFALLSGGAEHLILTTTGNTDEGEEGSATETDPREQLLFTQTTDATDCESDSAAQTTYITSVLMPSEQNEDIALPGAPPLEGVLTSVADISNNEKFQGPLAKPQVQSRKPGRPRKVVDDVQPPISKVCTLQYKSNSTELHVKKIVFFMGKKKLRQIFYSNSSFYWNDFLGVFQF